MIDEYALDAEPSDQPVDQSGLHDVPRITAILQASAREGRAMSYSEILLILGYRFTRPKMRTLCKTLDAVDAESALRGEPELACLVVREGDGLPGQGWWIGRTEYHGAWEGDDARKYLKSIQRHCFNFWKDK